ncbi:MAG: pilus assembly protein PilX [Herminiimonas sp.]|nr:pilus assembly protein PilX [Herminiimonas sp.]
MMHPQHRLSRDRRAGRSGRQQGIVLVTALLILIVLTVLAVSMFRNYGLQERIAGNMREKQRAFHAAQTALQYGEYWLAQGNGGSGTACSTLLDANATTPTTQICSNALSATQVASVPWKSNANADIGVNYAPPSLTVSTVGGTSSYAITPRFYISPLGLDLSGLREIYSVTAMGYGGNSTAVSVVQSVYSIKSGVIDAGGP